MTDKERKQSGWQGVAAAQAELLCPPAERVLISA